MVSRDGRDGWRRDEYRRGRRDGNDGRREHGGYARHNEKRDRDDDYDSHRKYQRGPDSLDNERGVSQGSKFYNASRYSHRGGDGLDSASRNGTGGWYGDRREHGGRGGNGGRGGYRDYADQVAHGGRNQYDGNSRNGWYDSGRSGFGGHNNRVGGYDHGGGRSGGFEYYRGGGYGGGEHRGGGRGRSRGSGRGRGGRRSRGDMRGRGRGRGRNREDASPEPVYIVDYEGRAAIMKAAENGSRARAANAFVNNNVMIDTSRVAVNMAAMADANEGDQDGQVLNITPNTWDREENCKVRLKGLAMKENDNIWCALYEKIGRFGLRDTPFVPADGDTIIMFRKTQDRDIFCDFYPGFLPLRVKVKVNGEEVLEWKKYKFEKLVGADEAQGGMDVADD